MILVVAAVIVDDLEAPTRVLAARRRSPPALAGPWEFPGGKVETGEDPQTALHRELREELDIGVDLGAELPNPSADSWPISVDHHLRLWFAVIRSGPPRLVDSHDELRWLNRAELDVVAWLPADTAVVAELGRWLTG